MMRTCHIIRFIIIIVKEGCCVKRRPTGELISKRSESLTPGRASLSRNYGDVV
jgi:hypothetical protein